MRAKSLIPKASADRVVKDIRRATRRHFSAEDKIRIVQSMRFVMICLKYSKLFAKNSTIRLILPAPSFMPFHAKRQNGTDGILAAR